MAFKGVTFSGQNVTPKNDGGLYNAHYGDGILWGCSMNISGDDLVVQSGEFIMGGRVVQVDGATNVDLSGRTLQTGYIQVIMNADLSQGEGSQWYTTFVESATTTFPALTQGNINDTDTLYQLELAVVQISGGNLTAINKSLSVSGALLKGTSNIVNLSGDIIGKIDGINWDGGNAPMFGTCQNDGTTIGGMLPYSDGTIAIGGTGGEIIFRPNGLPSNIGKVSIDGSGQFHGGATLTVATRNTTTSIPTATWTTVVSQNGLDASGIYVIVGYCSYTPSSNAAQQIQYKLYGNSHGSYHTRIMPLQNNSLIALGISDIITGDTSVSLQLYTNSNIYSGTASSGATLRILRIA